MANNEKILEFGNVNGFPLLLHVDYRKDSPKSRQFTISYKSKQIKSPWPKYSLFLAVIFNLLALFYVRISVTAILVIIIVLSFLVFFWITHSVQSETILVIPTVGIQSSVKYVCGSEDNFLPWNNIDDVIINEVIKMNRVLYFLTILIKPGTSTNQGTEVKLLPMFKYTKPRLMMLQRIYSELLLLLTETRAVPGEGSGDVG